MSTDRVVTRTAEPAKPIRWPNTEHTDLAESAEDVRKLMAAGRREIHLLEPTTQPAHMISPTDDIHPVVEPLPTVTLRVYRADWRDYRWLVAEDTRGRWVAGLAEKVGDQT